MSDLVPPEMALSIVELCRNIQIRTERDATGFRLTAWTHDSAVATRSGVPLEAIEETTFALAREALQVFALVNRGRNRAIALAFPGIHDRVDKVNATLDRALARFIELEGLGGDIPVRVKEAV